MPSFRKMRAAARRRTLPFRIGRDPRTILLLSLWGTAARSGDGGARVLRVRALREHPLRMRPGRDTLEMLVDACLSKFHLPPSPLEDAQCIWDLGANVGFTAADLARRYPAAEVVAVEADPETCALARRNLAPWSSVTTLCGAVWPDPGTVQLAADLTDSQAAGVGRSHARNVVVPTVRLDDLPTGSGDVVDYVKMDIEGAEQQVLARGGTWLSKVRVIKVEVHAPYTVDACERDLRRHGMTTARDTHHWATVIGYGRRAS